MLSFRAAAALALFGLLNTKLVTCRSPGESSADASPTRSEPTKDVNLPGVDTSSLTAREKSEWSRFVSELRSPCPDQPVSLAQCVSESRACKACTPAAKFLAKQVQRGRTRPQVEAAYKARFSPDQVKDIALEDSPSKGNPAAAVVIVEFADFQCPACRAARPIVDEVLKTHPGARLVFKHFPLSMHQFGEKAARAARAAQAQGKFWEMHGALFDNQDRLSPAVIEELAKGIGLDMAKFQKDAESEGMADAVSRDRKQGERLDIQSTPTLFINGRLFPPTPDFPEELAEWIDLETELTSGVAPAPATPSAPASGAPKAP